MRHQEGPEYATSLCRCVDAVCARHGRGTELNTAPRQVSCSAVGMVAVEPPQGRVSKSQGATLYPLASHTDSAGKLALGSWMVRPWPGGPRVGTGR